MNVLSKPRTSGDVFFTTRCSKMPVSLWLSGCLLMP